MPNYEVCEGARVKHARHIHAAGEVIEMTEAAARPLLDAGYIAASKRKPTTPQMVAAEPGPIAAYEVCDGASIKHNQAIHTAGAVIELTESAAAPLLALARIKPAKREKSKSPARAAADAPADPAAPASTDPSAQPTA